MEEETSQHWRSSSTLSSSSSPQFHRDHDEDDPTYHYLFQVKLCDLVSLVKTKLEQDGVIVREIRLNGSGASSVIMRMMMTMTVMMTMMMFLPLSPTIFSFDNNIHTLI